MESYKNIDAYIKDTTAPGKVYVTEMRKLVRTLVPRGEEAIRYGMPTVQLDGKNFLHYAAMKGHFGFYPTPSGVHAYRSELDQKGISYSKGCIRFPYDKPLPITLITKIIRFRLKEEKQK